MRIVGGVLAVIGGAFISIWAFQTGVPHGYGTPDYEKSQWLVSLIVAGVALAGGALAIAGKKVGGGLALGAGIAMILFGILGQSDPTTITNVHSFFYENYGWQIDLGFPLYIESIFMLAGGIVILASSSDF